MEHFFKVQNPLEKRRKEFNKITSLYPNSIPIIIKKDPSNNEIMDCQKFKFLINKLSVTASFINEIRKKLNISPDSVNFRVLTSDYLPVSNEEPLLSVYQNHKDEDGFLYLQYTYD